MRVVLVGPVPRDPTRFGGGVETSFAYLVEALAAMPGIEPHVVTLDRGAKARRSVDSGPARVDYLPSPARLNNLSLYRSDRRTLAAAFRELRPDVVHGQDAIGYGYATLKAARDLPVVLSVHGIVREELRHLPRLVDRVRTGTFRVSVERYCVGHAPYLAQPTRYPEEYFGARIRGRIVDVGNPVAERFFEILPAPEPGRLLYVGAVMHRKRLLDLVEAVARARRSDLPGLSLVVAGPLSDAPYVRAVEKRIEELGLREVVHLVGPRSPDEIAAELRSAELLVLPSGQETSPMVIGEAMAAGVPVLATRTGGVPYLVDDGHTGRLVAVGDVDALSRQIVEILADADARSRLAQNARADARARFRGPAVAERVVALYRQAIADPRPFR